MAPGLAGLIELALCFECMMAAVTLITSLAAGLLIGFGIRDSSDAMKIAGIVLALISAFLVLFQCCFCVPQALGTLGAGEHRTPDPEAGVRNEFCHSTNSPEAQSPPQ